MKRCFFAFAVVLALFSACSSGDNQEGEELVGSVVEPDPILGGFYDPESDTDHIGKPFAYRFTGSDTQVDITGTFANAISLLHMNIKVSGSLEYETGLFRFQNRRKTISEVIHCGNGSFEYDVELFFPLDEPGRYIAVHFYIRDASDKQKAYGYGFIRVNPDQ